MIGQRAWVRAKEAYLWGSCVSGELQLLFVGFKYMSACLPCLATPFFLDPKPQDAGLHSHAKISFKRLALSLITIVGSAILQHAFIFVFSCFVLILLFSLFITHKPERLHACTLPSGSIR
jgi:hypothetical protein